MFHRLVLKTDRPPREKGEWNNIHKLRAGIVTRCRKSGIFSEEELRLIDFRPPKLDRYYPLPVILYAHPRPGAKEIEIFSFEHLDILEKLKRIESVTIHDADRSKNIKIVGSYIQKDLPFLPRPSAKTIWYRTITPFIFYDKEGATDYFFALEKKHGEEGLKELLKKEIFAQAIKLAIKAQLSSRLKKPIEKFGFVDTIDIEVGELFYKWGRYHPEKPATPKIIATFKSDWELPIFVGHHTGKGFGRLIRLKNFSNQEQEEPQNGEVP